MKLLVFDVCLTEILIKLAWLTANEIWAGGDVVVFRNEVFFIGLMGIQTTISLTLKSNHK